MRGSHILPWSLVAASFLVVACGGKVVEGDPEDTDGGVGGGNGGYAAAPGGGGKPAGGSAGHPYAGGSAGYPYAGGAAGYPYGGGSAGWPAGGSAGWPAGGSAGTAGEAPYGMIDSLAYKTPFILDSDKLGDNSYLQQHQEALMYQPAFYGWYTYQMAPIPAPQAQTLTYSLHQPADGMGNPASVGVIQYSEKAGQIAQPYVYLAFASDKIQPGPVSVGLDPGIGAYLIIYHLYENDDYCAAALGFGQINVIAAENTTAPDGGMLAIGGQSIPLYHPTLTPIGDVSGMLSPVCPMQ